MQQVGQTGPENTEGGQHDQGALKTGRKEFDLAMTVGMALVRRFGRHDDADDGKTAGHHVDDGFQGVGEHGRRTRHLPGIELGRHQRRPDSQGGRGRHNPQALIGMLVHGLTLSFQPGGTGGGGGQGLSERI